MRVQDILLLGPSANELYMLLDFSFSFLLRSGEVEGDGDGDDFYFYMRVIDLFGGRTPR